MLTEQYGPSRRLTAELTAAGSTRAPEGLPNPVRRVTNELGCQVTVDVGRRSDLTVPKDVHHAPQRTDLTP